MAILGAIYFRIEDGDVSELNTNPQVVWLRRFRVVKVTPCGAWVVEIYGDGHHGTLFAEWTTPKHFVLDGQGKRLCYPNLISARNSYLRRKEIHICRLTASLALAKAGQAAAQQNDFIANIRRDFRCEEIVT